jgi:hypothetical protein
MGFIREPEGIDFTVVNKPLTPKQQKMISDHIKMLKAKQAKSNAQSTKKR